MAISVNLMKNKLDFSLRQKMACFVCVLWEVHQEHVSYDSDNACEKTLDNKYPLPGLQATQSTHL